MAASVVVLVGAPCAVGARRETVTEFSAGISAGAGVEAITPGPDGDLWFTEREGDRIGRITPAGVVSEFSAGISAGAGPTGITMGPDGDLWFTEREGDRIGRITTAGAVSEFASLRHGAGPSTIATGPEGDLWFAEEGANRLGRITTAGEVSEFSKGIAGRPYDVVAGPDGNLWFTESEGDRVGRITPTGEVAKFSGGITAASDPHWIAPGPDGNLWFTESEGNRVARIVSGAPAASVSAPLVVGGGQVGKAQTCAGATWSSWAALQPSASAFAFDGYRWLLNGSPIASGQLFTPSAIDLAGKLSCTEIVTYPLLDVTASATSAAVVVASLRSLPLTFGRCIVCAKPGGTAALTLSAVTQSAPTWREGARLASIARTRTPPIGTTFTFTLNEAARVTFTFTRRVAGRKVKHVCSAETKSNRHAPSCKRTVTVGALSFAGHRGRNRVTFQGRVSRSRKLAPGRCTLRVTARNASGERSQTRILSFTIVR